MFLGPFTPDAGGGYTFQHDILQSLLARAGERSDEFILLADTGAMEESIRTMGPPPNVRVVALPKVRRLEKWIDGAQAYSPLLRRVMGRHGRIERAAQRIGLDCLWYVSGGCYEATDTPYIATVWDLTHRLQPWFPEVSAAGAWLSREFSHRLFLQRASFVITGTKAGRDEVRQFYQVPETRIRILPHPTPAFALAQRGDDRADVRAKYGLTRDFLLYPAQFWPHKNHANLLLALQLAGKNHGVTPDLVLVGSDKGNEHFIRSLVREYGLEQRVHILGFVSQAELVGFYEAARAMVYPSFCGPENLPPLEAFALGCPVVAASISGSSEQLGECALLFDPSSPTDMAEKMASIITDNALRELLKQRGLDRARSWTADDFIRGVLQLLDEFAPVRRSWPSH